MEVFGIEMNKACPIFGEDCKEEKHVVCMEEYGQYMKVIFCDDDRCLWNKAIETKKFVKNHKDHTPFPNDYYRGICSRPEVGLRPGTFENRTTKRHFTTCSVRSDRHIEGHLDFSRLLKSDGTVHGGNIPDPVDPGTAYH